MTDDKEKAERAEEGGDREAGDVVLDLNFVPEWARKPADANPYAGASDRRESRPPRKEGRDRPGGGGKGRRDDRRSGRPNERNRSQDRGPRSDRGRPPRGKDGRPQRPVGRHARPRVHIPVRISFVPERDKIGIVVNDIREASHAYPLQQVAALFLARPEDYLVKIEVQKGNQDPEQRLYQCKETKRVFLREDALKAHCLKQLLDQYYVAEETEVDAPAGNFVCVSRCKLSGKLLGPPNHHSFKAQLEALHAEKFSHMTLEEYRRNIQTVRDPEVVEKWKEASRKKTVYKLKEGGEEVGEMTRAEAEEHFLREIYPTARHVANRMVIPADVSRNLEDHDLMQAIRDAWNKETRNHFTLSIALRPAFKHMGLALFRVGHNTYVSGIVPKPIDKEHVVPEVREIIEHLEAKPGCLRRDLKKALRPDAADDSEEVNQLVHHLTWLADKGHVIEFFNGKLALPMKSGGRRKAEGDRGQKSGDSRNKKAAESSPGGGRPKEATGEKKAEAKEKKPAAEPTPVNDPPQKSSAPPSPDTPAK